MISIHRDDVPTFLQNGSLYRTLDSNDNESFEVPLNCFVKSARVANQTDLETVLHSARYWGLIQLPITLACYLFRHYSVQRCETLITTFPEFGVFLKKVLTAGTRYPHDTIAAAISAGFGVKLVVHLHERERIPLNPIAYVAAAEQDDIWSMKYLEQRGCRWHEAILSTAIQHGSTKCLAFGYGYIRNGVLPPQCMQLAAEAGSIRIMQFLHKIGIPYHQFVYPTAANLEVVKHLRSVGCAWASQHCSHFAARNQLDCLIFANATGSPWSVHTTQAAALHGRVEILEYLHTHGCPWDAQVTYNAALKGHNMCLKYALTRDCPCTWRTLLCGVTERKWMCIVHLLYYRYWRIASALLVGMISLCIIALG